MITIPSFIFLTAHINNIQQILWILLFSGRLSIYRIYRSKQFWTPKLVDQKKLNVKLYLWTHVQFLVQHVLSRLYRNIVHTCWWKTQKGYCGKKNCEYLRYLQSWKYGDLNQDEQEILQRKWFPDDYRNLGNFSNFGHIF